MKTLKYFLIGFAIIIVTLVLFVLYSANKEIPVSDEIVVVIPRNTTISQSIEIMNSHGVLKPKWFFLTVSRFISQASDRKFYSGYYTLKQGTTNFEVLTALFTGKMRNIIVVTFPEGITLQRFAQILKKRAEIDSAEFVRLAQSDSILKEYKIPSNTAEGYLMPNTYNFYRKQKPVEILRELLDKQNKIWKDKFEKQARAKGITKHNALTMASIIEAETPVLSERPIVSGVYYNRLNRQMLLQADPTVQYSIGEKHKLKREDLRTNSPYNTYIHTGLPPGPINSPSISSIEAALNPVKHNYLFFVAVGDSTNRHNFAANYARHSHNVNLYRKNYRIFQKRNN